LIVIKAGIWTDVFICQSQEWRVHDAAIQKNEQALASKVEFLSRPETYGIATGSVTCLETHMSWVFLAGNLVYKIKKPVRLPYLDFSTLERRETACRAELRLNRRLAPDVYLDVVPLIEEHSGLSLGGKETPIDWLVKMKRLDDRFMLDRMIEEGRVQPAHLERLSEALEHFYRRAEPVRLSPAMYLASWRRSICDNQRVLSDARLGLPPGLVRWIGTIQQLYLQRRRRHITERLRHRHIIEGHGDLRPEHICLDEKVRIIDCLEFNDRLRAVDPFDEIAFLSLECERLGARWVGEYMQRRMMRLLRDGPADELFTFYYCYRAALRARLTIAHLFERPMRTPEKWPRLARVYLGLAEKSAHKLEILLRTP
jgi:aminoglycoside phosphotransferase family enzyme